MVAALHFCLEIKEMANTITFTAAKLESFSRNQNGGKAKFSCGLNTKVMQAMGWVEIPECLTGADLEGELHATAAQFIPSDTQLEAHKFDLEISEISKFESVRLEIEGKKGKGHRTELRFVVEFGDQRGAAKLEKYMVSAAGDSKASLKVSYTPEPVQGELLVDDSQGELEEIVQDAKRRRATAPEAD